MLHRVDQVGFAQFVYKLANIRVRLAFADFKMFSHFAGNLIHRSLPIHPIPNELGHYIDNKNVLHIGERAANGNDDRFARDLAGQKVRFLPWSRIHLFHL